MPNQRRTSTRTVVLVGVLVYALLGTLLVGAVSTNTLEAGYRFNGLVQRVRLALDPPPDREKLPVIEVTASGKDPVVEPDGFSAPQPAPRKAEATPRPKKKPVDLKLRVNPERIFASQATKDWCAVAGTQIVLAMHGITDNSEQAQRKIAGRIDEWESRRDSRNGGWGPSAMAQALADHGLKGYEVSARTPTASCALRDAAVAIKRTPGAGDPPCLARCTHLGHDRLPGQGGPGVLPQGHHHRRLHLRPLVPAHLDHLGTVGSARRLPGRGGDGAELPPLEAAGGRVCQPRRQVPGHRPTIPRQDQPGARR